MNGAGTGAPGARGPGGFWIEPSTPSADGDEAIYPSAGANDQWQQTAPPPTRSNTYAQAPFNGSPVRAQGAPSRSYTTDYSTSNAAPNGVHFPMPTAVPTYEPALPVSANMNMPGYGHNPHAQPPDQLERGAFSSSSSTVPPAAPHFQTSTISPPNTRPGFKPPAKTRSTVFVFGSASQEHAGFLPHGTNGYPGRYSSTNDSYSAPIRSQTVGTTFDLESTGVHQDFGGPSNGGRVPGHPNRRSQVQSFPSVPYNSTNMHAVPRAYNPHLPAVTERTRNQYEHSPLQTSPESLGTSHDLPDVDVKYRSGPSTPTGRDDYTSRPTVELRQHTEYGAVQTPTHHNKGNIFALMPVNLYLYSPASRRIFASCSRLYQFVEIHSNQQKLVDQ